MGCLTRTMGAIALSLTLATGCTGMGRTAVIRDTPQIPWDNRVAFVVNTPPPPELAWKDPPRHPLLVSLPTREEWGLWKVQAPTKQVCRGKGKRRSCKQAPVAPMAAPPPVALGPRVRYLVDLQGDQTYTVQTSPSEPTYLLLPEGERQAVKLLLNPYEWEVSYGKSGAEGSRREVIVVKPLGDKDVPTRPLVGVRAQARAMLVLQSGLTINLKLVAQERPGMLNVTWDLPDKGPVTAPVPIDQQPPLFDSAQAYGGYRLVVEGKHPQPPAWFPEGVCDDGKNTLIKLPGTLEGVRLPIVTGIQQTGKPALVQSRLYIRPDHGAWLYVQGQWQGLRLTDGAGVRVTIERLEPTPAPQPTEKRYVY